MITSITHKITTDAIELAIGEDYCFEQAAAFRSKMALIATELLGVDVEIGTSDFCNASQTTDREDGDLETFGKLPSGAWGSDVIKDALNEAYERAVNA